MFRYAPLVRGNVANLYRMPNSYGTAPLRSAVRQTIFWDGLKNGEAALKALSNANCWTVTALALRHGKPFKQDTVTKLLLRVQNGGTYSYAGHVVEDGMPSLWPKHEQDMIISMLKRRRKPHRRVDSAEEWPLTGKLWCACCDGTLSGTSGTSATGKTYAYYKCHKCGRTFRRDVLEEAIVDVVIQAVKRKEIRENIALLMSQYDDEMASSAPLESERLKKEIKRIDAAFERIWRAIEDGIAPPGGKERVQELQARKTDLETEYQIAKANESLEPNYDDLMQWLDEMAQHLTPKEILKMFIRAAEIEGDVVKLFFAFDYYGDDFTPPKMRHELSAGGDSSCNSLVVEPSITSTNPKIQLQTCYVQLNRNWFCIIGDMQKPS